MGTWIGVLNFLNTWGHVQGHLHIAWGTFEGTFKGISNAIITILSNSYMEMVEAPLLQYQLLYL